MPLSEMAIAALISGGFGLASTGISTGLNFLSSNQAYNRQRALMEASQDYNSSESEKQRIASSIYNTYNTLGRLGLNRDLVYQNGASQGSMSNAVGASAPSVSPANIPSFMNASQAIQSYMSAVNSDISQQNTDIQRQLASITEKQANAQLDVLRNSAEKLGAEATAQVLQNKLTKETFNDLVLQIHGSSNLSIRQSQLAVISVYGALMNYIYTYGAGTANNSGDIKAIFGHGEFEKFVKQHGVSDDVSFARTQSLIQQLTAMLSQGNLNLQKWDALLKSSQLSTSNAQFDYIRGQTRSTNISADINQLDLDLYNNLGTGSVGLRILGFMLRAIGSAVK